MVLTFEKKILKILEEGHVKNMMNPEGLCEEIVDTGRGERGRSVWHSDYPARDTA